MKRGLASLLLIIPLLGAVMLFSSCPIKTAEASTVPAYQRPSWAVNKPGTIKLYISDIDAVIEYDPNMSYNTTYTLSSNSSIYIDGGKSYTVQYEIISSISGVIKSGSASISEADYESSSGTLDPNNQDIGNFSFSIPPGFEGIQSINLVINYNITGLKTKIDIPIQIKKPPSGTSSVISVPIFYSASPIVPKENSARVEVTSRTAIVSFNLTDATGCLSMYTRFPSINYDVKLKYGDKEVGQGNIFYCKPSSIKGLPTEIRCTINLDKDSNLYSMFTSQAGAYLELEMEVGPYNCMTSTLYTISVSKYR